MLLLGGQAPSAISRALAQIADRPDDLVDAYFERTEELLVAPAGSSPTLRLRREEGVAVRLLRGERTWLSSRDRIAGSAFTDALRQTARVLPRPAYPFPELEPVPWDPLAEPSALLRFPGEVEHRLRERHVAFPTRFWVRRHHRRIQVVGPHVVPDSQEELFYSVVVETPWGPHGTLLPELGVASASRLARSLLGLFRSRDAASPAAGARVVVLGPSAAAVLLHEAVAHALEVDVAAVAGEPQALLETPLGSPLLDVLDDPAGAPAGLARQTDDEGSPVRRRWLLREGRVEQLLSDVRWSRRCDRFEGGSGRRGHRHEAPGPRSYHLELVPGATPLEELLREAEGGLWLPEAQSGRLDPVTREVRLDFRGGRRIGSEGLSDPVGACSLVAPLDRLLGAVTAVGAETVAGGAGWCAKEGSKLPVWATAPALRLEGLEVRR